MNVYTKVERPGGGSAWLVIGEAARLPTGEIEITLEALPVGGVLRLPPEASGPRAVGHVCAHCHGTAGRHDPTCVVHAADPDYCGGRALPTPEEVRDLALEELATHYARQPPCEGCALGVQEPLAHTCPIGSGR